MIFRTIGAAACIGALAACSTPYGSPVFAAKAGGDTSFPGVAAAMERDRPLDVLFVHGMCTHDATWAAQAIQQLAAALGARATDALRPTPVPGTEVVLYQQTLDSERGQVRANALLWSPVTTPLKQQLCYDESDKSAICKASSGPAYPYDRASLNKSLKDGILDDCLSDAMIYQGKSRDQVSEQVQKAILLTAAGSQGADAAAATERAGAVPASVPFVVVAESLGSKIAFDAIYKLVTSPDAATAKGGQATFDRTTQIFMGANQLPILALADQSLPGAPAMAQARTGEPAYPTDPIAALIAHRQAGLRTPDIVAHAAPRPPQVIAFSDPNDLLSYTLAPSQQAAVAGYPVVDVIVSNTTTWLGLFELPTTAHTSYLTNDAVARLIACGHPASATCR